MTKQTIEVKRLKHESQIAIFSALERLGHDAALSEKLAAIDDAYPFERSNERAKQVYQDVCCQILGVTRSAFPASASSAPPKQASAQASLF